MARWAYWLIVVVLILLPGATWMSAGKIWPGEVPCLFCLFTAVLIVCLTYRWWRIPVLRLGRSYMQRTARKKGWLCRQHVGLTPEGLVDTNPPTSRTVYQWRDVRQVTRHGEHAFLYVGHAKAIVIPQRAFAAPADFDAFVTAAELFRSGAHPRAD